MLSFSQWAGTAAHSGVPRQPVVPCRHCHGVLGESWGLGARGGSRASNLRRPGAKGGKDWQREACWRGEQFNVINSCTVYREQAVCTLQSLTGHYTSLFPVLFGLVTDTAKTILEGNPQVTPNVSDCLVMFTGLIQTHFEWKPQRVSKMLGYFPIFKKAFSVVSTFASMAQLSWSWTC